MTTATGCASAVPSPGAMSAKDLLRPLPGKAQVLQRPDGTRLHVVVEGQGPRSVLLEHGFAMSADVWSLVRSQLDRHDLRVIAYDRRAHGRSTCGSEGLSSAALHADLRAVAEHFALQDAVIACHSMGNFLALGAMADERFMNRFRLAVLVNPVTGNSAKGAPAVRIQAPLMRWGIAQRMARIPSLGRKLASLNVGRAASGAIIEATRLAMIDISRELWPLVVVQRDESVEPVLGRIGVPLHVLTGTEDRTTPPWHAELIVAKAPNAKIDYVADAGHMLPWEAPELIVRAILDAF